jgi:hypothetical protein
MTHIPEGILLFRAFSIAVSPPFCGLGMVFVVMTVMVLMF